MRFAGICVPPEGSKVEHAKPEAKPVFDDYLNCGSLLHDVIIWMHDTGQHPI